MEYFLSCFSKPAIERIKKFLVKRDDCWIFTGRLNKQGYGTIKVGGKYGCPHHVHRIVYEFYKGKILPGLLICHKCDVKACCNPDHLFMGTQKDNMQDMIKKGRQVKTFGEKSGNHKLKKEQVDKIRVDNRKYLEIAKEYKVSKSTISGIKNWKTRREG